MADSLAARLAAASPASIGDRLTPDLVYFRHHIECDEEGRGHLEVNLIRLESSIHDMEEVEEVTLRLPESYTEYWSVFSGQGSGFSEPFRSVNKLFLKT